ncbi:hypothetical protein MKX40_30525 [Paenibacillus sp. FSL R5-0517]|uniref:phosphoribosyltransferase-like protein n=1 Tax=Paenibacillus sp. FSL R5-0517 TaxID=2921647 RepID=UPI0030D8DC05
MNNEEIIKKFIEKYGEEEYFLIDIKDKFYKWIDNTESEVVREILIQLFSEFEFFPKTEVKRLLLKQLSEILHSNSLDDIAIFSLPSQSGKTNSSDEMTMLIREIVREHGIQIYEETIKKNIEDIEDDEYIKIAVFFDDISGSGKTITDFLREYKEKLDGKKIIINLLAATDSALQAIEQYRSKENLDIQVKVEKTYGKIFTEHPTLKDDKRILLSKFEEEIWGKGNRNIMGFKDSQLIIGFYHNIPNNTLSSFWYHSDFGKLKEWNTLFKRFTLPKRGKNKQNFTVGKSKRRKK